MYYCCMEKYISNYSAAAYWRIPYIEVVLGTVISKTGSINYTVSQQNEKYVSKDKTIYFCEIDLPDGAVVSRKGIRVASPELVFLQLAGKLDMHRLILLGLQLCSHPPAKPDEAITSKQKIKYFVEKTQGHRGRRKSLRAIKYIQDGSASIMESIVYMVLTLPHALGGYGLSGPVFNYEVKLKDKSGKRLGQKRCFVDLYYKQAKVCVEYDSFAYHNSPSEQGKDALRSAILERQSIEVMHLSTIQLYDREACMDFAFNLASRLGKRMQIRANDFEPMHIKLRTLLPRES